MKKIITLFLILLLVVAKTTEVFSQKQFEDEIKAFKKSDSISFPPKNAILFVGSSSFRKWTNVQSYFPHYTIINRGFGGSTLPDVIYYTNDIIIPYHPKQVVIYCGDNDLASADTVTSAMVAERFIQLFYRIRKGLPKTGIAYVSIKPSASRQRLQPKMMEANGLIKNFLKQKKNTSFIDVFSPMLLPDGKPRPDIFLSDSLHMNEKGYAIWQKIIQPYLKK